jgi:hypothetical protein
MCDAREKTFAELWSRAQHDRGRYVRSWLGSAYRNWENWLMRQLNVFNRC